MRDALVDGDGPLLAQRLSEHIVLTFTSTALACVIGVSLGLCAFHFRRTRWVLTTAVHIVQTVPSLALLVLLLALIQRIGAAPAMIALTLYALLPIMQGTLTGLESTPTALVEAARGLGLTRRERLLKLHLPLALPNIVASIRVAATIGVGVATIAAFIGAGGLGQFINRGLFLNDTRLILLGAIPAALLALVLDAAIAAIEHVWFKRHDGGAPRADRGRRFAVLLLPIAMFSGALFISDAKTLPGGRIVVGSKNFTEQLILGELAARIIERETGLPVTRRFGLGGSPVLHRAVSEGEIDLYPEYTGTALASILKLATVSRADALSTMRREYAARYHLSVLDPLGFDNRYVLLMEKTKAGSLGISAMSDLKAQGPGLRAGVDFEFAERPDGLKGLHDRYGIAFASVQDVDPSILYTVLAKSQVDVISGYATDGRIDEYGFVSLADDLDFFPPYQAVFVLRQKTEKMHPQVRRALDKLSGMLDEETMRRLNHEVDAEHKSPAEVAADFLARMALGEPTP